MHWSFPLIRVAGSEIRIHLTFFLLLLWLGVAQYQQGGSQAAVDGLAFILAVFACVVLHELGHAVAARRYGIRTPRITLFPIGGVAELERMPEKPSEEIVVAVAGPLVNVVIAAVIILFLGATVDPQTIGDIGDIRGGFLQRLAAVNIILVLFNLIPAFPMDGGRVLRALLATRWPRSKATEIAARIGQMTAFLFGFLGLVGGNPLLIFIAIFVYLAAEAESRSTMLLDIARKVSVRDALITNFESLGPDSTLGEAGRLLLRTTQHEFPVLDGAGKAVGFLTRASLVSAIAEHGDDYPVADAMEREIPAFTASVSLEKVFEAIRMKGAPAAAINDANGRLTGYITSETIGELMMLHQAHLAR